MEKPSVSTQSKKRGKGSTTASSGSDPYHKTTEMLKTTSSSLNMNSNIDDLSKVLTDVQILDRTCEHDNCKHKTSLIFFTCQCCNLRYCAKHQLPEIHGCAEKIKKAERSKFLHPPKPSIQVERKETDKKKAKERLSKRLDEMQQTRRQKQPVPNSKKTKGK